MLYGEEMQLPIDIAIPPADPEDDEKLRWNSKGYARESSGSVEKGYEETEEDLWQKCRE